MDGHPSPLRFIQWANALSYASLGASLLAIEAAVRRGDWGGAGAWIALAALADMYDGRFARLFHRGADQQAFGTEIDSLVDVVAFGVGPIVCVMALGGLPSGLAGIALLAAAMVYLIAVVTRLGFFNLASHETGGFVGVPTTIAGLAWSSLFLLQPGATLVTAALVITGALMVLPIRIPRPMGWRFLAFPVWALGLAGLHALR